MASRRKGCSRRSGSKVRKHAITRLAQYAGNTRGFSRGVARRMLLSLQRLAKRNGDCIIDFSLDSLAKSGDEKVVMYFRRHRFPDNLYLVLGADWSVMNVLQKR